MQRWGIGIPPALPMGNDETAIPKPAADVVARGAELWILECSLRFTGTTEETLKEHFIQCYQIKFRGNVRADELHASAEWAPAIFGLERAVVTIALPLVFPPTCRYLIVEQDIES